jgi:dTMP kinase
MFIVLEGLDGAGKSTQLKLLQNYLTERQIESECLHFPRFDAPVYGELIAKFLRGDLGDMHNVSPYVVALLYSGDRHNAAKTIGAWIEERRVVLVDRYVYSNIAYQCAKLHSLEEKTNLRKWILNMEYGYFGIPKPDLTLFLDVPLKHVEQKLDEHRSGDDRSYLQGKKDIHEASIDLQEQVRAVYLDQSALDSSFHVINCGHDDKMLPAETIFEKIKSYIKI